MAFYRDYAGRPVLFEYKTYSYLFGAVSVVGLNPPVPDSRPNLSDRSAISPIN